MDVVDLLQARLRMRVLPLHRHRHRVLGELLDIEVVDWSEEL